jgi:hypothetical protein
VARENGQHGFASSITPSNAVEGCTASANGTLGGGNGFYNFRKVVGCVAILNWVGDGISVGDGVCINSTAQANGDRGIEASASTVADCDASYNNRDGIWADGSMVKNNTVAFNTDDGIELQNRCHVWRNNCTANGDDGIMVMAMGTGNNIEGNHCVDNMGDAIDTSIGGGNSILSNREHNNPGGYNLFLGADTHGRIFAGAGVVNTGMAADQFVNISY